MLYLCIRKSGKESWQSDRSRWTRNPVYAYAYRGFESLTLRPKQEGVLLISTSSFFFKVCNLNDKTTPKPPIQMKYGKSSIIAIMLVLLTGFVMTLPLHN